MVRLSPGVVQCMHYTCKLARYSSPVMPDDEDYAFWTKAPNVAPITLEDEQLTAAIDTGGSSTVGLNRDELERLFPSSIPPLREQSMAYTLQPPIQSVSYRGVERRRGIEAWATTITSETTNETGNG